MTENTQLECRRAIEALRAGVPNRDAVSALGSEQKAIEERFLQQVDAMRAGETAPGILIAGGFGTGKSHLLAHLQLLALKQGFVCSKVVVSKETPLYDPVKLLFAAVHRATAPGRHGAALSEIAEKLQVDSPAYAELERWALGEENGLSAHFPASLFLFRKAGYKSELGNRILAFWSGAPINVSEVRKELRAHGEAASYRLSSVKKPELALQRFRFLPRLAVAAGYAGWILFVDEIELISRYSPLQRAKSYAELARWLGKAKGVSFPNLLAVCAITRAFEPEVLDAKNDAELLPDRFGSKLGNEVVQMVKAGIKAIRKDKLELRPPDPEQVLRTFSKVRSIYEDAHGWPVPNCAPATALGSAVLRAHVRAWINEWDLQRLYPSYIPNTVVEVVREDFTEDHTLETPSEDETSQADEGVY